VHTPLDESLHGFLIRQQLIYMHQFDPKGVIAVDGGWRHTPFSHREVLHLFEPFDDLFLLEAIDVNIQLGEQNHQFLDGADNYLSSISAVFFDGARKGNASGSSSAIKYCHKCIEEMLRENGFGYFRKDWGGKRWCYTHDVSFRTIKSSCYKTSVELVRKLLSGKKVPSRELCKNQPAPHELNDNQFKREHSLKLFYPIRAVKCSAKVIGKCLIENQSDLSEYGLPVGVDWLNLWIRNLVFAPINSLAFYTAENDLERLMVLLQQFSPLVNLLDRNFSYYKLWVGPRKQLSEIILAPKNRACNDCKNQLCRVKMEKAMLIDRPNLNYLVENSTSLRRLAFQQLHLPVTGVHPWSPIKIKNYIEKEELESSVVMKITSGGVVA